MPGTITICFVFSFLSQDIYVKFYFSFGVLIVETIKSEAVTHLWFLKNFFSFQCGFMWAWQVPFASFSYSWSYSLILPIRGMNHGLKKWKRGTRDVGMQVSFCLTERLQGSWTLKVKAGSRLWGSHDFYGTVYCEEIF